MIDLLQSLVNAVSVIFDLIISSIKSLVTIITYIPGYISYLNSFIQYLPAVFLPFIAISISLWLLYFVLGREH